MQDINNKSFTTCDQHKRFAESRITRGNNDYHKILEKLSVVSPFRLELLQLMNICTEVISNPDVNVHMMHDVGENILKIMIEKPIFFNCF